VTFGGVDSSKYSGSLTYVFITKTSPASEYWGIDISSITYGSAKITGTVHGIVDNVYDFDPPFVLGHLCLVSKIQNITFTNGGVDFTLTHAQYTVPRTRSLTSVASPALTTPGSVLSVTTMPVWLEPTPEALGAGELLLGLRYHQQACWPAKAF
ncbi:hypothetical protein BGZ83_008567, partial [Gryganskiella cystojenkinii]